MEVAGAAGEFVQLLGPEEVFGDEDGVEGFAAAGAGEDGGGGGGGDGGVEGVDGGLGQGVLTEASRAAVVVGGGWFAGGGGDVDAQHGVAVALHFGDAAGDLAMSEQLNEGEVAGLWFGLVGVGHGHPSSFARL